MANLSRLTWKERNERESVLRLARSLNKRPAFPVFDYTAKFETIRNWMRGKGITQVKSILTPKHDFSDDLPIG